MRRSSFAKSSIAIVGAPPKAGVFAAAADVAVDFAAAMLAMTALIPPCERRQRQATPRFDGRVRGICSASRTVGRFQRFLRGFDHGFDLLRVDAVDPRRERTDSRAKQQRSRLHRTRVVTIRGTHPQRACAIVGTIGAR